MGNKDKYDDIKTYGFDLLEDLKQSPHHLDYIESILGEPIRKKIKRINEKQFSIHLSNKDFILATKVTGFRHYWIFNYQDYEKDTRQTGQGKYEEALENVFLNPGIRFRELLKSLKLNEDNWENIEIMRSQTYIKEQIQKAWLELPKKYKKGFANNIKLKYLKLI